MEDHCERTSPAPSRRNRRYGSDRIEPAEIAVAVLAWLHLFVYLAVTLFTLLSTRPYTRPIGANFGPLIGHLGFSASGCPGPWRTSRRRAGRSPAPRAISESRW